ncbi:MAG: hypothetical protein HOM61_02240 [Candidatus Marinimicrobia bacterium]|nr:hypothetical protein [Candidatus Neomarinimicrobiota bacterium]
MVYKLIQYMLLLSVGFSAWIQNPSPVLVRPFDAKSTALGGINSFENSEQSSVQFSFSVSKDNILEENSIVFDTENKSYYLSYFGVSNLDNTIDAWSDNGDGMPSSDEIDYTRITSFSYRSISFTYPVQISTSKLEIWPTFSFTSLYEESAYSAGFSISKKIHYKNTQFLLFIHDAISSKRWSTNRKEVYQPFLELIVNSKFKNTTIFLDGILNSSEFNSNIGVSFNIHENLNLRGGYAGNDGFTLGAGVKLNFIELDIAVLPSDSLHPFKPTQQFTVKLLVEKVLSASKRLSP